MTKALQALGIVSAGAAVTHYAGKVWNHYANQRRLCQVTVNLNDLARGGLLSRAFERDVEIGAIINALGEFESKNNFSFVILEGVSGCGKTALVQELAHRIIENQVPTLSNATVLSLDHKKLSPPGLASEVSELFSMNPMELKFEAMINEIKAKAASGSRCILFIDEIHILLKKYPDVFSRLHDELDQGLVRIIGATTESKSVEDLTGYPGFKRRIKRLRLQPPDLEQSVKIVQRLGKEGKVVVPEEICRAIVIIAHRHFTHLNHPVAGLKLLGEFSSYCTNHPETSQKQMRDVFEQYVLEVFKDKITPTDYENPETVIESMVDAYFKLVVTRGDDDTQTQELGRDLQRHLALGDRNVEGKSVVQITRFLRVDQPQTQIRVCYGDQIKEVFKDRRAYGMLPKIMEYLKRSGVTWLIVVNESLRFHLKEEKKVPLRPLSPSSPRALLKEGMEMVQSVFHRRDGFHDKESSQEETLGPILYETSNEMTNFLQLLTASHMPYLTLRQTQSDRSHFVAPQLTVKEVCMQLQSYFSVDSTDPMYKEIEHLIFTLSILYPDRSLLDDAICVLEKSCKGTKIDPSQFPERIFEVCRGVNIQLIREILKITRQEPQVRKDVIRVDSSTTTLVKESLDGVEMMITGSCQSSIGIDPSMVPWLTDCLATIYPGEVYFITASGFARLPDKIVSVLLQQRISELPENAILIGTRSDLDKIKAGSRKTVALVSPVMKRDMPKENAMQRVIEQGSQLLGLDVGLKEQSLTKNTTHIDIERTPQVLSSEIEYALRICSFSYPIQHAVSQVYTAWTQGVLGTLGTDAVYQIFQEDLQRAPPPNDIESLVAWLQTSSLHHRLSRREILYVIDPRRVSLLYRGWRGGVALGRGVKKIFFRLVKPLVFAVSSRALWKFVSRILFGA